MTNYNSNPRVEERNMCAQKKRAMVSPAPLSFAAAFWNTQSIRSFSIGASKGRYKTHHKIIPGAGILTVRSATRMTDEPTRKRN